MQSLELSKKFNMNRPKIIILLLFITALSLGLVRTVIANSMTTEGVQLGKIEDKISAYKTENLMYKEKILTLASLWKISSSAAKLGFVEGSLGFVIPSSIPIARR